jgi:hypothetical protein
MPRSSVQLKMFHDEIERYIRMTEQEQRLRLNSGRLPTVEEFWGYRLGASAVFIMLAVNEYVI